MTAKFIPAEHDKTFLAESIFVPYQDEDAKAAAQFLETLGAKDVFHRRGRENGLAGGNFKGEALRLGTNGYFYIAGKAR